MKPAHLILVRHAHATSNSSEERILSDRGLADAAALVPVLAKEQVAAIYSSPFRRALQTVEPLAAHLGLDIRRVDDLRERRLGVEVTADSFEECSVRSWDDFDWAHPAGEANRAAQLRGVAAVERILAAHSGETVVVASHGTLITLILRHFDATIGHHFWCHLNSPDVISLEQRDNAWVIRRRTAELVFVQPA